MIYRPALPMAPRLTIRITDDCNLRCAYCFAQHEESTGRYVSEEDFGYFLGFCLRSGMRGIRITGGEPMKHPHAHRFIRLAVQAGLPVHIFSNFTIPDSIQGINVPAGALSFLVNVNDKDTYGSGEWDVLTENLKRASESAYQTVLAYTVHSMPFNLEHIKELAVKHGVSKIRISPAKPIIGANNLWIRQEEIPLFAASVHTLYLELATLGKQLVLDCPIPICHIPPEYLPFFLNNLKLTGRCGFGISVDVNLEVGHCYITNSLLERRSLRGFKDASEMLGHMAMCVKKLDESCPVFDKCNDCNYRIQKICTAGCYGIRHYVAHGLENVNG